MKTRVGGGERLFNSTGSFDCVRPTTVPRRTSLPMNTRVEKVDRHQLDGVLRLRVRLRPSASLPMTRGCREACLADERGVGFAGAIAPRIFDFAIEAAGIIERIE